MSLSAFGIAGAVFAVVWLSWVGRGIAQELRPSGPRRWAVALFGAVTIVGFGGFLGTMLAAVGMLRFPASFEWPAGHVSGIARTQEGVFVVPLVAPGRIQLYDPEWRFLRGWQVDALGGDFTVECAPDGILEVQTARGARHYSFTQNGDVVRETVPSERSDASLRKTGESATVPTSPLLWVFSSPLYCWALGAIGIVGGIVLQRVAPATRASRPSDA